MCEGCAARGAPRAHVQAVATGGRLELAEQKHAQVDATQCLLHRWHEKELFKGHTAKQRNITQSDVRLGWAFAGLGDLTWCRCCHAW